MREKLYEKQTRFTVMNRNKRAQKDAAGRLPISRIRSPSRAIIVPRLPKFSLRVGWKKKSVYGPRQQYACRHDETQTRTFREIRRISMQRDTAAVAATDIDLLRVSGLSIAFRTGQGLLQATRDVCLTIARGERIGLVGESGCGKTITGLSLMRLLPPALASVSGDISLEGQSIPAMSNRALRALRGRDHLAATLRSLGFPLR